MIVYYDAYVIKRLIAHGSAPVKESWFYLSGYTRLTGPSWTEGFHHALILPEYKVYKVLERIADKEKMCDSCRRRTMVAIRLDKLVKEVSDDSAAH